MMYSDETLRAISTASGWSVGTINRILEALESTDEQKALRANAESQQMRMKHCVCQEGLCHYCRTGEARGA